MLQQFLLYHKGHEVPRCSLPNDDVCSMLFWRRLANLVALNCGSIHNPQFSRHTFNLLLVTLLQLRASRPKARKQSTFKVHIISPFRSIIIIAYSLHLFVRKRLNALFHPGWGLGFSKVPGLAAKGIPLKTSIERTSPRRTFVPWTLPPSVSTTPSWNRRQQGGPEQLHQL